MSDAVDQRRQEAAGHAGVEIEAAPRAGVDELGGREGRVGHVKLRPSRGLRGCRHRANGRRRSEHDRVLLRQGASAAKAGRRCRARPRPRSRAISSRSQRGALGGEADQADPFAAAFAARSSLPRWRCRRHRLVVEIVGGERPVRRHEVARRRAGAPPAAERVDGDDDVARGVEQPVEDIAPEQDVAIDDDAVAASSRSRAQASEVASPVSA